MVRRTSGLERAMLDVLIVLGPLGQLEPFMLIWRDHTPRELFLQGLLLSPWRLRELHHVADVGLGLVHLHGRDHELVEELVLNLLGPFVR